MTNREFKSDTVSDLPIDQEVREILGDELFTAIRQGRDREARERIAAELSEGDD